MDLVIAKLVLVIGLDTHPSERRDEIDQKLFPYPENGSECSVIALTSYCFEKVIQPVVTLAINYIYAC